MKFTVKRLWAEFTARHVGPQRRSDQLSHKLAKKPIWRNWGYDRMEIKKNWRELKESGNQPSVSQWSVLQYELFVHSAALITWSSAILSEVVIKSDVPSDKSFTAFNTCHSTQWRGRRPNCSSKQRLPLPLSEFNFPSMLCCQMLFWASRSA